MGYTCAYPQGAFYVLIKAPFGTALEFSEKAKTFNLLIPPCERSAARGISGFPPA